MPKNVEQDPDLLKLCQDKGIRHADLKFCDLLGKWRHVTLPVGRLSDALRTGVGVDGSSLPAYTNVEAGDLRIMPDPGNFFIDPFWLQPTLSITCYVIHAESEERYERDSMVVASKAEGFLKASGVAGEGLFMPELEFYLFDTVRFGHKPSSSFYEVSCRESPEDGRRIGHNDGYHVTPPMDTSSEFRAEVVEVLSSLGVSVKYHHHEVGSWGQLEVEFGAEHLLKSGDNVMLAKYVIRNIAAKHGRHATFMAKPMPVEPGSGMHVHQHLFKNGEPLFYEKEGYSGLSQTALHYIGGLLKHSPSILAFAAPTVNSYRRLLPGVEAPTKIAFSTANRTASIRIPLYAREPKSKRIEYRPPDPSCNPYLTISAMLMAGLDGVKKRIDPTAEGYGPYDNIDISKLPEKQVKSLPPSLEASLQALKEDHDFLLEGEVFTEDLVDTWIEYKTRKETLPIKDLVHPYEYILYFDM